MSTSQVTPQNNSTKTHEYLTPQEVADLLRVSTDTVMRWFGDRPGVINLGSDEDVRRRKRRYRIIRIPWTVYEKFIQENRIQ